MSNDLKHTDRRSFIKAGLASLAAGAAMPAVLAETAPAAPAKRPMVYRTLGKTNLKLPVVSMGVMNADNPNLVRAALDAGVVHLDTAHGYQRGRNEEMIGGVIKGRPRDSFVIGTKVVPGGNDSKTGLYSADTRPEAFLEKFELSLKRLGLTFVDILYVHNVSHPGNVAFGPILEAVTRLKQEGKTRFIGISTHRDEPKVIQAMVESKAYDVVLTAYNFRQPHLAEMNRAIEAAAKAGLGVVAMKTQAGAFWDEARTRAINMSAALKWALQNENVHTAIPGFTTFDQMEVDLAVMTDLHLTPAELKDLRSEGQQAGLYCGQCGRCTGQCPAGLDIPTLMRGYMYAHGYRNLLAAQGCRGRPAPGGAALPRLRYLRGPVPDGLRRPPQGPRYRPHRPGPGFVPGVTAGRNDRRTQPVRLLPPDFTRIYLHSIRGSNRATIDFLDNQQKSNKQKPARTRLTL